MKFICIIGRHNWAFPIREKGVQWPRDIQTCVECGRTRESKVTFGALVKRVQHDTATRDRLQKIAKA